MPNRRRLSTLYYDFIPTSFISQSVTINSIIEKVISNAVTGEYKTFDKNDYSPHAITLSPFVQYMEEDKAIQFIDEFTKKETKIMPDCKIDNFCVKSNLETFAKRKPTCFLVLGKPSSKIYRVAKYLAQKTNRCHIDVIRMVAREIIKNTPLGNWLWANLAWSKKIPINIAMMLLCDELNKKDYKRRGYVLSGLPIITSCDLNEKLLPFALGKFPCVPKPYVKRIHEKKKGKESDTSMSSKEGETYGEFEDEEYMQEKKYKHRKFDSTSEEVSEEEWETSSSEDESSYPGQANRRLEFSNQGTYKLPLSEEVFSFSIEQQLSLLLDLDMPPDIVVYLNIEDNEDIIATKEHLSDEDKYNFLIQLERYENAFSYIQNFLLHYSKETVIKLDGRHGLINIFQQLDNRLEYLNYKKIYDAEWLFPKGIPEELKSSFEGKSLEDCLQILCETNTIQKNFYWLKSNFLTYCPIESYRGKRVQGRLDYSVRYLGYTYFLSSYENMKTFISEPEKYFFSEPTCRVAIIGHSRVGKTTLAKHLKCLLNGEIYDVTRAVCELRNGISQKYYVQAYQWGRSQGQYLTKKKSDYFKDLKIAKLNEWKENVLSQLKDVLDILNLRTHAFTLDEIESILKESIYFKDILPEGCQIDDDYEEIGCAGPIVNFFLDEKLTELYTDTLLENDMLADDFIEFVKIKDENLQIKSNFDKRYSRWIIDGAPTDLKFWKKLEENDCLPDVFIFLSNYSEEKINEIYGRGLNRKFTSGRYVLSNISKAQCHYCIAKENVEDLLKSVKFVSTHLNECIAKYSQFLAPIKLWENINNRTEIEKLENYLKSKDVPLITTNLSDFIWSEVVLDALLKYVYLFKTTPRRIEDPVKLSELQLQGVGEEEEEEEEYLGEEEEFVKEVKAFDKSILKDLRLGNLGLYCPVMFTDHEVLVKSRPHICIEYDNLLYFFHSEECLSKFVRHPEKYANIHKQPVVPPMRIWIIGANSSEKIHLSELLADEFRIKSIYFSKQNFVQTKRIAEEYNLNSLKNLDNFNLSNDMIKKLKYFFKNGAILTGFPSTKQQFMDMISNSLYPEAILILNDHKSILEYVYTKELDLKKQEKYTAWKKKQELELSVEMDIEENIIEEFNEIESSEGFEYNELTKSEKKKIYKLCSEAIEALNIEQQQMEKLAISLNIPIFRIPKHIKNPEFLKRLRNFLHDYHDRCRLFDQTLDISMSTAMLALDKGFFRYSKFGKSCPVDVENIITINHFIGSFKRERIFPCLYREFIYFINGKNNLQKFKDNPAKYVNTTNPYQYSAPLRIAVLGPPRSGCTTLCNRIAEEFGMQIFTKTNFETLLKTKFHWTEIYRKFVNNKNYMNEDILAHCLMLNENATPNGIILDNFPLNVSYIMEAAKYNVDFHIILVITPNFEDLWSNWRRSSSNIKTHSIYQLNAFFKAYSEFMEKTDITNQRSLQLFNIFSINSMPCKWAAWSAAKSQIIKTIRGIVGFETNVAKHQCASLAYVNIFENELLARFAPVGPYCPICVIDKKLVSHKYEFLDVGKHFYEKRCQGEFLRPYGYKSSNIFYKAFNIPHPWSTNPDYPPLLSKFAFRTNLFAYEDCYYWSCDDHLIELLLNTSAYLPLKFIYLPPFVPFLVLTYRKIFLEHDGLCVVTYAKNLPNMVHVKGNTEYAIYYRGKVFLVASEKNALEFLREPQKYYRIEIKLENSEDFDWDLHAMDFDLGTLTKELVAKVIVEVANVRPKHFAMSTMESAAVLMALHLKLQNNLQSPLKGIIFQSSLSTFLKECQIFQNRLKNFKKYRNPFIQIQDS